MQKKNKKTQRKKRQTKARYPITTRTSSQIIILKQQATCKVPLGIAFVPI